MNLREAVSCQRLQSHTQSSNQCNDGTRSIPRGSDNQFGSFMRPAVNFILLTAGTHASRIAITERRTIVAADSREDRVHVESTKLIITSPLAVGASSGVMA